MFTLNREIFFSLKLNYFSILLAFSMKIALYLHYNSPLLFENKLVSLQPFF